ncbi:Fungal Zn2-Cys6 binuclear cluster domain-containing protein [Cladophialophora immunda]|nr:Fungal Zn2-Cys6 binuclear cluster domain-containing protein [Cladophialophora immunda]
MNGANSSSGLRQAQAHLSMRKGTRSCSECRRRKTKCTYGEGRRTKCDECYARGAPCVAQDKGPKDATGIGATLTKADGNNDGAKYSLRERVARLEDFVENYLSSESTTESPDTGRNRKRRNSGTAYTDSTPDGRARSSTNSHLEANPILSLFDNDVITRICDATKPSLINSISGTEPLGFHPARYELLTLLPHEPDLNTLIDLSKDWWNLAPHRFPELFDREETTTETWRSVLNHKLGLANPAESAKALLWTLISAERLSDGIFHDGTFRDPTAIATLESRILPAINRAVVFEDDIATTLPGIECLVLLSRYFCNQGKLRKAWHLCRRALEYAIDVGLDRASPVDQSPIVPDQTRHRQIEIWEAMCFQDRYLSMALGLPHSVQHSYLDLPKRGLDATPNTSQQVKFFYATMSSIMGQIIDRNQQPLDDSDSLLRTLKIDQELKEVMDNMNYFRWEADSRSSDPYIQEAFERIEAYFLMHFIQALLHLPLMLKCIGKRDKGVCQYSYAAATRASRQALVAYKYLRIGLRLDPYLCTMLDFQAFTMAVLLILHLLDQKTGSNEESDREHASDRQDERDWKSIADVADILRRESRDNRKSVVAKQAVVVLDVLLGAKGNNMDEQFGSCPQSGSDRGEECQIKIAIPCFGEITVARGMKGPGCLCLGASANTVDLPPYPTAALLPLSGREEAIFDPSNMGAISVSISDSAARFDGNWSVLARNVASAVAANSN